LAFKSSSDLFGDIPGRSLYNHSDTLRIIKTSFKAYKDRHATAQDFVKDSLALINDRRRLLENASAELWTGIQQQHRRYNFLRKAILLFMISVFAYPFVAFLVLFPW